MADFRAKAAVFSRLERLRLGLFGDCKSVGFGVEELTWMLALATASTLAATVARW